jgi:predicted DNA-binding protein with PD1-like motif
MKLSKTQLIKITQRVDQSEPRAIEAMLKASDKGLLELNKRIHIHIKDCEEDGDVIGGILYRLAAYGHIKALSLQEVENE